MNILVTGGSGFLGSRLALELLRLGHNVSLLLRPTSRLERLGEHSIEFTIGRAATDSEIQSFVSRVSPDIVVHTACSYGRQAESLLEVSDANFRYGLVIAQAVIANNSPATFINTGTVLNPKTSFYAMTKRCFAQAVSIISSTPSSNFRFINVQLQHMYGPGDDESKFTTHIIRTCARNEPKLDLTLGTQIRDFIYIDDVVSAYVTILDRADALGFPANIEVGSGVAQSVRAFVETAHRISGSSTQLNFGAVPFRTHEAMYCRADISQMNSLGWAPKYDLENGIRMTLKMMNQPHL
jgi:nucleoside-diphosphate-sugar epimerase